MAYTINTDAIQTAINNSDALEFEFGFITPEDAAFSVDVLRRILEINSLSEVFDELSYILMELITNANKANVKKIFYMQNNCDINQTGESQEMLKDFSHIIQSGFEQFVPLFSQYGVKSWIRFEFAPGKLWIKVINNRAATLQEKLRIQSVLLSAGKIRNTIEAFDKMTDRQEGANLGTLTSILMLRRIGLTGEDYRFESDEHYQKTTVTLCIRLDMVTNQQADRIADVLAAAIDKLPAFPENILKLLRMISDENVDFSKIAGIIQSDPALTADLLKIVNSAQYMLPQKVGNINNALSLIGIRGIQNLLYSFGTQQIFEKNFGRFEQLWEHAYQTASYAYNLAKELKLKNNWDDVYLGGILHDMGKILIYQVSPGLLPAIREHCGGRLAGERMLETLAVGVPHSRIAAEIATKWNFPDFLIDLIRYHHTPLLAPDAEQERAVVVYLADVLCHVSEGRYGFDSVPQDILDFLHISRETLPGLESLLKNQYHQQKQKMEQ